MLAFFCSLVKILQILQKSRSAEVPSVENGWRKWLWESELQTTSALCSGFSGDAAGIRLPSNQPRISERGSASRSSVHTPRRFHFIPSTFGLAKLLRVANPRSNCEWRRRQQAGVARLERSSASRSNVQTPSCSHSISNTFGVAELLRVANPRSNCEWGRRQQTGVARLERGSVSRSNVQTPRRFHFVSNASGLAELLRVANPRSNCEWGRRQQTGVARSERGPVSRSNVQTPRHFHFIPSTFGLAELLRVANPRSNCEWERRQQTGVARLERGSASRSNVQTPRRFHFIPSTFGLAELLRVANPPSNCEWWRRQQTGVARLERGSASRSNVQTPRHFHFIPSTFGLAELLRVANPRSNCEWGRRQQAGVARFGARLCEPQQRPNSKALPFYSKHVRTGGVAAGRRPALRPQFESTP